MTQAPEKWSSEAIVFAIETARKTNEKGLIIGGMTQETAALVKEIYQHLNDYSIHFEGLDTATTAIELAGFGVFNDEEVQPFIPVAKETHEAIVALATPPVVPEDVISLGRRMLNSVMGFLGIGENHFIRT